MNLENQTPTYAPKKANTPKNIIEKSMAKITPYTR
jgi:hypothetical protein